MSGQDSSPIEPTKAHTHTIGRGGVGNLQEAKKYAGLPHEQPQLHRVEPVDRANQIHSTGRGGTGNFKVGPDETSSERDRRLSTSAKPAEMSFGRGGAGNIEAAKALQKKKDEEKMRESALITEKARAEAKAAAEGIQMPKPTRSV